VDIATLTGILAGFGMAFGAVFLGSAPENFVHAPSLMFVLGGTCAAILLTSPAQDVWQAVCAGVRVLAAKSLSARDAVSAMVHLAEISRNEGIMALEEIQTSNPILKKAVHLVTDNASPDLIRDTLDVEILALRHRRGISTAVFLRLAICAPAMGMLGTLAVLLQMLTGLKAPDPLGPGIALALMTTFYGCLLSMLVFLPIASKLKTYSTQEEYRLNIIFAGVNCILENNNPSLVFEKLSSFLTPRERASVIR